MITYLAILECDHVECETRFNAIAQFKPSPDLCLKLAKLDGWKEGKTPKGKPVFLCPLCQKANVPMPVEQNDVPF